MDSKDCGICFREWIQAQVAASDRAQVSVLYASAYGNTAALAQGISRGITKAGTHLAPPLKPQNCTSSRLHDSADHTILGLQSMVLPQHW